MNKHHSSNTPCPKIGQVIHVNQNACTSPLQIDTAAEIVTLKSHILQEIGINTSTASSPSNMTWTDDEGSKKPRASLNLLEIQPETLPIKKTHCSFRQRFESFLDVELHSRNSKNTSDDISVQRENVNLNEHGIGMFSKTLFQIGRHRYTNSLSQYVPAVWVIEPSRDLFQLPILKFTTDKGACLILKTNEAIASIDMLKEASGEKTYFQVYSVDGTSSKVIGSDQIAICIQDIVNEFNLIANQTETPKLPNRLGHRFFRFVLQRKWQRLKRQQAFLAMDHDTKKIRFASLLRPIQSFWNKMTKASPDAPISV